MRKGVNGAIVAGLGVLLLAGCDGGAKDEAAEKGEAKIAASGWDASDACALLDKAAVGAALGDTVTETSLAFVNKAEGANAATSECTYRLAGGSSATLMARRSPIADNSDAAIRQTRETTEKTMAAFSDKKIVDVAGLGKAAFFVPGINQMNVFLDDSRFVILTIGSAPDATAKDVAVELVGKIRT
ncbi:hypothetical protein SAMN05428974_1840 [Sphingopyxis sp. YR583]|jgi:hypothetical protein|uniref:hypothetical protein n=1 Tax=Sphingopyxis sp. YR583 TaxID=1881047 RepID=UPI0008A81368|nr:hypothetical protein [Sphingopyxis sp. YR583]SEH16719.1 hypothetical protein SAMN05428974_1840 [Sphingopyxis sp. YR583]